MNIEQINSYMVKALSDYINEDLDSDDVNLVEESFELTTEEIEDNLPEDHPFLPDEVLMTHDGSYNEEYIVAAICREDELYYVDIFNGESELLKTYSREELDDI